MYFYQISIALILLLSSHWLSAQDFVYQPQNPAFGGSYLNYSWLLSSAQAQNSFTEERDELSTRFDRDPMEDFEQSIKRQILSQLSRQLVSNQFGENGLQEGQYEIGNYQIDVLPGAEAIQVVILDVSTGSETIVSVPYF